MSLRDAMRKAAGLLVELPPEESASSSVDDEVRSLIEGMNTDPSVSALRDDTASGDVAGETARSGQTKTVEQIVQESEGPNLDEIEAAASPSNVPVSDAGQVNFSAIYNAAKLPPAPFSAEQMLDMMTSLPAELPLDTKRQTVNVTLGALGKSLGATPETIVADASRKLAALNKYLENLTLRTEEFSKRTEEEIAALQAQIEEKRKAIQSARHKLTQVTQGCEAESDRLDDVLEFFSLDVAPSKYSTPGEQDSAGGAPVPPAAA